VRAVRLAAVTFGSRGDIEPFVTLGRALVQAGHEVRLLTHPEYAPLADGTGVELVAARGRSTRELIESDEGREVLGHMGNPLTMLRRIADVLAPELHLIYEDTLALALDADAVLAFPATFPALDVADHLGRPVVHVHHVPAVPTRGFPVPAPYISARSLTPLGNRASYAVDALLLWRLTRGAVARTRSAVLGSQSRRPLTARRALAQRRRRAGAIVGVSPHVLPPPRDWPRDVVSCGYWWSGSDAGAPLDPATEAFLAAGPPPVFFGLGSTPLADAAATTRLVTGAARDAGVRLVLQRGWAGLGDGVDEPDVHVVGDIPYHQMFPRVAAVAHHGGAGTTALGLRHGRPTLCLPALADQFFWGHRIAAIGAGPSPLPVKQLQRARLTERLAALVEHTRYLSRASALAPALASEDGCSVAVAAVERFLAV
jgi:UDP:flavonoid glycosyltransferase YjiC (YdhE family)